MLASRLLLLLFLAAALLAASPGAATQEGPASAGPIHDAITVVLDDNYPPYIFRDAEGRLQGLLVDEWRLWEKQTGVTVVLMGMDWGKALGYLLAGNADVIDTIFFTPERDPFFDFTRPYARIDVQVFARQGLGGIVDLASIAGFVVGVKAGDASNDVLRAGGVSNLREYDSYEAVIRAAKRGEIHVFCMDKPPALYYLYKLGMERQFQLDFDLGHGEFHRAVRKGRRDLLNLVESGFAAIPPAQRAALERKWMGSPLAAAPSLRPFLLALAAAGGVVLVLGGFTLVLRRTVRRQTARLNELLEEVRVSEERWSFALEGSQDGVWDWDLPTGKVYYSRRWKEMLGYSDEEVGNSVDGWDSRIHPEDRDRVYADLGRHLRGETPRYESEHRVRCKDGAYLWILDRGKVMARDEEGKPRRILGTHSDIGDRKRAEAALAQSEDRYRQLFEMESDAILLIENRGGRILEANQAACHLYGYTRSQLLSMRNHDLSAEPGETRRVTREGVGLVPLRWHRKSGGEVFPVEITGRFFEWEGRSVHIAAIRDISSRMDMERKLLAAKDAAEAANRAKGEFLANVSHELRTPLNGVLAMLQILDQNTQEPDRKELVRTALESGRGLLSIINDILTFARIEAGRLEIHREPVELRAILDSLQRAFRYEVDSRGLSLSAQVDASVPRILLADPGRLRQVLFNLMGNALKFTEKGGVEVSAQILPYCPARGEICLLVSVADTGIGIPDEMVAAVFEPFTQADGSLSRRRQGVGIGLGIVRSLVRLMDGTLAVESEAGQGTTMHFTIPCGIVPEAPAAAPEPESDAAPDFKGLRVLLAEDDRVNRFAATRFLEGLGCSVMAVADGRHALELLEREDFDLLVLDIQMPEMDGLAVARAVRSAGGPEIGSRLPILAMTAHVMPGDREQFLAAGMDGYVAKPVELADLVRAMAQVLGLEGGASRPRRARHRQR
ncbi:MAG: transporter substrate-binding domain-containing protein [Thermodesulfobacteriota bacterium]